MATRRKNIALDGANVALLAIESARRICAVLPTLSTRSQPAVAQVSYASSVPRARQGVAVQRYAEVFLCGVHLRSRRARLQSVNFVKSESSY